MASHSHSHSHSHGDEATAYFMDQLFAIAVCGAIACVTIVLWQSNLLGRMLHPKFHPYVLAGGIALLVIVTIRAVSVWLEADRPDSRKLVASDSVDHHPAPGGQTGVQAAPHSHSHGAGHDHSHSHAHSHAAPAVTAPASDHADHDHGWAPWRYIVLLLPVLLYFLALSNPIFDKEPAALDQPFSRDPLPYITTFIVIFRSILWEAMPFIVLGAVIAGTLEEFLPQRVLTGLIPRNPVLAVAVGGMLGIVFPMCECGIVPIMRRLLRKGLPLSCCVAYLLAGPIVNVVVLMSTYAAFNGMENTYIGGKPSYQMGSWWMLGLRAGLGYLTAVVTGLLVEWQWRKHGVALLTPLTRPSNLPMADDTTGADRKPAWERVSNVSATALHDFVDITVFLILGALLAAGVRLFLTPDRIADLGSQHAVLAIGLMMVLAVVLCLCSEADAFVAASLVALRPSAKLAFLVLGPMLDFKLYAMYTRIFRPRLILTIYAAVLTQVFVYSLAVHVLWEAYKEQLVSPQMPETDKVSDEEVADQAVRATAALGQMGAATAPSAYAVGVAWLAIDPNERAMEMSPLRLENAAQSPQQRGYLKDKLVYMTGRFTGSDRGFTLLRYKMGCCAADAIPLKAYLVPEDTKKSVPAQNYQDKWVRVTGRLDFRPDGKGGFVPFILLAPTEKDPWDKVVQVIAQPSDPYIY